MPVQQLVLFNGIFSVLFWIVAGGVFAQEQPSVISRKQAAMIAEQTPEAEGLYSLKQGRFRNCIEIEVLRPCESDWVTCIEDAWVVRFLVGDRCDIKHDGRLSVTFLMDDRDGRIISRFPEKEYFENAQYCLNDNDCLFLEQGDVHSGQCLNFIAGQVEDGALSTKDSCFCREFRCGIKEER